MRIALVFVLACSSAPKPEPVTPIAPAEPVVDTAPAAAQDDPPPEVPGPPAEPATDADLETPVKPMTGTQPQIAWQTNRDGVALVKQKKYPEATMKFRDAVARLPEAAYFYNLCHALFLEGKFAEALVACNAVGQNEPKPALQYKAERMSRRIKAAANSEGIAP